jgi:hypothetical protein
MSNESPTTVQKTEEELFQEILEAREKGEDVGKLLENVEVLEAPAEPEVKEPESEEEPATTEEVPEVPEKEVKAEPAEKKPEDQAPSKPDEDWIAGLPEEAQAKAKALMEERQRIERDHKALLGRVPYLNRKVDELQRQLSTRPAPAVKSQEPAAPKTSVAEGKFATKLAEARAVDPALADLLEAMRDEIVNPLREEIATKTEQTAAQLREKEELELWQTEKAKLLERIPQADEVFRHPLYKEWKKTLPENQYRLANSIYADDVEIALTQFAKYAQSVSPDLVQAAPAPVAQPLAVTQPPSVVAAADKIVADRARKLAAGSPATANPTPKAVNIPDDPEARFALIAERIKQGKPYADLV